MKKYLKKLEGNREIRHTYTAHVLDVVNQYNWRHNLVQRKQQQKSFTKALRSG